MFEIVDFTSASEWELFISKLEEIILFWQISTKDEEALVCGERFGGKWKSSEEDVSFAGESFLGAVWIPL